MIRMINDPASQFRINEPIPFPMVIEPTRRKLKNGEPRVIGRLVRPDMIVTVGFHGPAGSSLPPTGRKIVLLGGLVVKSEPIVRDAVPQYGADPRSWHVELRDVEWSMLGNVFSEGSPFCVNLGV